MTREQLIQSAEKLKKPSAEATQEYFRLQSTIAAEVTHHMQKRADIKALVGENNIPMMVDNHHNHVRFMHSIFTEFDPEVLVDTILWVFHAYQAHGFQSIYWAAQLNTWIEVLEAKLSKDAFSGIYPFYNWLIVHIPIFDKLQQK